MTPAALADCDDPRRYGGKAVQLGAAARAGLPVPDGFGISVELVEALAKGDAGARTALERAWPRVRPPVAVRSSAVGEDSAAASFAGQHATCLNVDSPAAAAAAVTAVWRSAHSDSALAYRERLGLPAAARIAVVVQELVEPDCAGVLFTRNPLDGADELVVEASWGLGEAVVAGLVTPDRYRVARDGAVLERVAGEKDVAVVPAARGGTRQVAVAEERVRMLCLDERRLAALAKLAAACAEAFAGPRDLEWALVGDDVHLLQCRAITRAAA